jgi:hypothetical protein
VAGRQGVSLAEHFHQADLKFSPALMLPAHCQSLEPGYRNTGTNALAVQFGDRRAQAAAIPTEDLAELPDRLNNHALR